MRIRYYILLIFGLLANTLLAQDVRFTATTSKSQVATGEVFEVTFSINNNAENFTPPSFSGLQVVGGPNTSQSMQSINGNMSMSLGYGYDLVATKEGEYTIGAATIVVGGKRYTTQPIRIKVVKGAPVRQNSNQGNRGVGSVGSGNVDDVQEAAPDIDKTVFLRAELSKPTVYQGEQLMLTYRLYFRAQCQIQQISKSPDYNGFWNEESKSPGQQRTAVYNGRQYNVVDIKQMILFPDHAGDIAIDPMHLDMVVMQARPARSIMEQFFGENVTPVKYTAKSNKVVVHVKPLPDAGKPEGFGGAVGKFSVTATIDKKELRANETLNYKLLVQGAGNIKLINPPSPVFPADFEKYDPKTADSIKQDERGIRGSRLYTYLLIPRHEGNYTIEPLKFSYFNPATNRYQTITTEPFQIKVNKGVAVSSVTTYADQPDIKQLGKDIRYIKTSIPTFSSTERFFGSAGYYLWLLLGPLLFGAAWWYRKWNTRYNSDIVKVKSRKASKVAAKHLAHAQKQLAAGNSKVFYEAVFRGLYGYLSDKLNIPVADLNKDNIADGLRARNVDEQLVTQLISTLDLCEMARYAPVSGISEQEVFERSKGIINDIEDKI